MLRDTGKQRTNIVNATHSFGLRCICNWLRLVVKSIPNGAMDCLILVGWLPVFIFVYIIYLAKKKRYRSS